MRAVAAHVCRAQQPVLPESRSSVRFQVSTIGRRKCRSKTGTREIFCGNVAEGAGVRRAELRREWIRDAGAAIRIGKAYVGEIDDRRKGRNTNHILKSNRIG